MRVQQKFRHYDYDNQPDKIEFPDGYVYSAYRQFRQPAIGAHFNKAAVAAGDPEIIGSDRTRRRQSG